MKRSRGEGDAGAAEAAVPPPSPPPLPAVKKVKEEAAAPAPPSPLPDDAAKEEFGFVGRATTDRRGLKCPYLDTVNRPLLDFDFEKVCSVSLSNHNVYGCLVCGKFFQGRGQHTHAYTHSVQAGHHVFINLDTGKVYCLPGARGESCRLIVHAVSCVISCLRALLVCRPVRGDRLFSGRHPCGAVPALHGRGDRGAGPQVPAGH